MAKFETRIPQSSSLQQFPDLSSPSSLPDQEIVPMLRDRLQNSAVEEQDLADFLSASVSSPALSFRNRKIYWGFTIFAKFLVSRFHNQDKLASEAGFQNNLMRTLSWWEKETVEPGFPFEIFFSRSLNISKVICFGTYM